MIYNIILLVTVKYILISAIITYNFFLIHELFNNISGYFKLIVTYVDFFVIIIQSCFIHKIEFIYIKVHYNHYYLSNSSFRDYM